jgi:hypothetical protein
VHDLNRCSDSIADYDAALAASEGDDDCTQGGTPRSLMPLLEFARANVPIFRDVPRPTNYSDPLLAFPLMDRNLVKHQLLDTLSDRALTQSDIASHFALAAGSYHRGKYQVFLSAGGGGDLAYFLCDRNMWRQFCSDFLRHFRRCGANPNSRIAFRGTSDRRHTLCRFANLFPPEQVEVVGLQDGLHPALQQLTAFDPELLCGFSSALGMIAREQLDGRLQIRPLAAEIVSP